MLTTLTEGWNNNDATTAASVFSSNAIYAEPPNKQLYVGKDQIFKYFGGEDGRKYWMQMVWHHLSFNEKAQTGAREFTFSWDGGQVHGMVSIKIEGGKISR